MDNHNIPIPSKLLRHSGEKNEACTVAIDYIFGFILSEHVAGLFAWPPPLCLLSNNLQSQTSHLTLSHWHVTLACHLQYPSHHSFVRTL